MGLRKVTTVIACLGLFQFIQADLRAADQQRLTTTRHVGATHSVKQASRPAVKITDVMLKKGGILTGLVLDDQGRPVDGKIVSVRQGTRVLATTVTDSLGRFQVRNLRGGFYQVVAGQSQELYRIWAPKTAPPSARESVVIVSKQTVVRGQIFDCCSQSHFMTAAVIAGATGVILHYGEKGSTNSPVSGL